MNNRHNDWLRALTFYKQELGILRERLTEIAGKNTGRDVMAQTEHYENQLKLHTEKIDKLVHDIQGNLAETAAGLQQSSAGYIDGALLSRHDELEIAFVTEEQLIARLRSDFHVFAATWM